MVEEEVLEYNLNNIYNPTKRIYEHTSNGLTIVALFGELGTGKTTLVKHLCEMNNVDDQVSSPTFSLINIYNTKDKKVVYHFDLYRLKNINEVVDIGFFDYIDSNNLCLIEWPQLIVSELPENTLYAYLEHPTITNTDRRKVTLKYPVLK